MNNILARLEWDDYSRLGRCYPSLRLRSEIGRAHHDLRKAQPEQYSDGGYVSTPQLYCLSRARKGHEGYAPFFISGVKRSSDRRSIAVGLTYPEYATAADDIYDESFIPTKSYAFVNTEGAGRATMYRDYIETLNEFEVPGCFATNYCDQDYYECCDLEIIGQRAPVEYDLDVHTHVVDWRKTLKGRMVPATVKLLWKRFKCPECDGKRKIILDHQAMLRYVRRPSMTGVSY